MDIKKVEGFEFLLVANAYLSQKALSMTFNKKPLEWNVALDLMYPEIVDAEQSVYLVYRNDELKPVYIGQYSDTFKARWLRSRKNRWQKYMWHSMDEKIKSELNNGHRISVWLSIDPYIESNKGAIFNINKEIENSLIKKLQPEWNTVGKSIGSSKAVRVKSIVEQYKSKALDLEYELASKFKSRNVDNYKGMLSHRYTEKSNIDLNWSELQAEKLQTFARARQFIGYLEDGMSPEEALEVVWKEFPVYTGRLVQKPESK